MSLTPYRRHLAACELKSKGQNFTLCECPIHAYGTLRGEPFRRSLNTNDWNRALRRIEALEQNPDTDGLLPTTPARGLAAAVKAYIADAEARNLRPTSIQS